MKRLLIAGMLCIAIIYSCQEQEESSLTLSMSEISFADAADEQTFNIQSNTSWTIAGGAADWCSISPMSGTGNATVTVQVSKNPTREERVLALKIGAPGILPIPFSISQDGYTPEIIIPPGQENVEINYQAQKIHILLKTNTEEKDIKITCATDDGKEWLRQLATNRKSVDTVAIIIDIDANSSKKTRSASIYIDGGKKSRTVTLTQKGEPDLISISKTDYYTPSRGSDIKIRFRANVDVMIDTQRLPSWITIVSQSNPISRQELNDKEFTLKIAQYTDETKDRFDSVFIVDAARSINPVKVNIHQTKLTLREKDSLALLEIYAALHDNGEWRSTDGGLCWDPEKPISTWKSVYLNEAGRVEKLRLMELKFGATYLAVGEFPTAAVAKLTELKELTMNPSTSITGTIGPEFENLTKLETLSCGDMGITQLNFDWSKLESLKLINFARMNALKPLPGSTQSLLVPSMGGLKNLQSLQIGGTKVTDTIPNELGNLAIYNKLEKVVFENTGFTGVLPKSIANIKSIQEIHIINNSSITGPLPVDWVTLPNLRILYLNSNQLTGTVPEEFGEKIPADTPLEGLTFGNNAFTGDVPQSLKYHYMWHTWYTKKRELLCAGLNGCGVLPGAYWYGSHEYGESNAEATEYYTPAVLVQRLLNVNDDIYWEVTIEGNPEWIYFSGSSDKWKATGNTITETLPLVIRPNTSTTECRSTTLWLQAWVNGVKMPHKYPFKYIQRKVGSTNISQCTNL